jgi:selenide,water dikinase
MTDSVTLTDWTSCGGCAAKFDGSQLRSLISPLAVDSSLPLIAGLSPFDDAAVFRLTDDLALVSTLDFFPPLIDDPYDFGFIAAANACSDIYAMGGRVSIALNIAGFPEELPIAAIAEILAGARDAVSEAGGVIAGGHTVRNPEPIFGLAVQGIVNPNLIWRKGGAMAGDVILLSKPLGTGLVTAKGSDSQKAQAIASMKTLNSRAADSLRPLGTAVHAVTDVTGFGLAGHAMELSERSEISIELNADSLPLLNGAIDIASSGFRTGGDSRNRSYVADAFRSTADSAITAVTFDPQTSGGLLTAVDSTSADGLISTGLWWSVGHAADNGHGVTLR